MSIYIQLGPGVSHTLAGMFVVANVRTRDILRVVWLFSEQQYRLFIVIRYVAVQGRVIG